jgi:hypothetical protein
VAVKDSKEHIQIFFCEETLAFLGALNFNPKSMEETADVPDVCEVDDMQKGALLSCLTEVPH